MALTRLELIKLIQQRQGEMSLRSFATSLGVSAAYLSDFYRGRRDAGPSLLKHFGYRRLKTVSVRYMKTRKEAA